MTLGARCEIVQRVTEPHTCACGCGTAIPAKHRYVYGHNQRGLKHGPEWLANQSKGVKRAWRDGQFHRPETIARRAAHLAKARANRTPHTAEHMAGIRAKRDPAKWKASFFRGRARKMRELRRSGELAVIHARTAAKLRGTHGFGRCERGRLDHHSAKSWVVRDQYGTVFRFSNLREWARQNEHRFHDDRPESRCPFWYRISAGIKSLASRRGKATSYRGWVLVSLRERFEGEGDLLGRDEAPVVDAITLPA